MLEFLPPSNFERGVIARLLRESYASVKADPAIDLEKIMKVFDDFDNEVHDLDYVANCTFITTLDGVPIGVGSFDPTKRPEYGDIGHNCIVPSAQGKGYGRAQIREILRRFRERGIQTARVSTGAEDFGAPARRMYEACGFKETRRFKAEHYPFGTMVEYEMPLS